MNFDFGNKCEIAGMILLIVVVSFSCNKKTERATVNPRDTSIDHSAVADSLSSQHSDQFSLNRYLAEGEIGDIHVENFDFDCALFIYPTKEQVEQLRQQESEDDFNVIVDDNMWYLAEAMENVDSTQIETISTTEKYIRLKGLNKTWELDVRKKNLPLWNVILFNRVKEPVIVSPADLTVDDIRKHFDVR